MLQWLKSWPRWAHNRHGLGAYKIDQNLWNQRFYVQKLSSVHKISCTSFLCLKLTKLKVIPPWNIKKYLVLVSPVQKNLFILIFENQSIKLRCTLGNRLHSGCAFKNCHLRTFSNYHAKFSAPLPYGKAYSIRIRIASASNLLDSEYFAPGLCGNT